MAKDNWETPWTLVNNVNRDFPLVLDVCTDGKNAKCDVYLTDSLTQDWAAIVNMVGGGFVWCNPPYSKVGPWVDKLIETLDNGVGSVLLVNAGTSSLWFHQALSRCAELWIFKGRIAFTDPDTGLQADGNDRSQCLFVFNPEHQGNVIVKSVEVKVICSQL